MNIVSIEPESDLKHIVRKFWYASAQTCNTNQITYKILSDGAPGIIFQHRNGQSSLVEADGSRLPISFVYGQSTQPCINHFTPGALVVGVNFQPTALKKLFSIDASELTNMLLESEYLFSKQFTERLLHTSNPHRIIQLITEELRHKLLKCRHDRIIDESIRLIIQKPAGVDSAILSKHFHLSRRQFQRKFKEYAGVCPETYVRIMKFQKSIHLLKFRQYDKLSDIAYLLNYADQSHFGREFKLFAGCTPNEFLEAVVTHLPIQKHVTTSFETVRVIEN